MNKLRTYLKATGLILVNLILTFTLSNPLYATSVPSRQTLNSYGINGIYYYNPSGNSSCSGSSFTLGGSNTNYAGAEVFNATQMAKIKENQPFYESSANKYGLDWKIIAVIHNMEHSLTRDNPANGQGAYQLYTYTAGGTNSNAFHPTGPISDAEFQRQTDIAAEVISKKAAGLNLNTPEGVKTLFFRYNGTSSEYKQKALNLGFNQSQANTGEGSPYVMNRYDSMRDPTSPEVSPYWKGKYTSDGNFVASASMGTRFGAYVQYVALGGADSGGSLCYYGTGLASGENGMTLDQATEFMEAYKARIKGMSNSELIALFGMTSNTCSGGIGYNCVSFSKYFINTYTNYSSSMIRGSIGDGKDVVQKLTSGGYNFTFGTSPRVYAIFSDSGLHTSSSYGHTGVVLGINTEANEVIVGEAGCGSGEAGVRATNTKYKLDEMINSPYITFAYPNQLVGI